MARRQSKTAPKSVAALAKRQRAVKLRLSGLTFEAIGQKLGCSKGAAFQMVDKAMKDTLAQTKESTEVLRELEVQRLDTMLEGLWPKATKGNVGSVDRVLRLMKRRSALLGLDAPRRGVLTGPDGGPIQLEGKGLSGLLEVDE